MPKCGPIGSYCQNQAVRAHVRAGNGPKTAETWSEDKSWPEPEVLMKIIYTPRLARNSPFAHLGAPRGCQSVVLLVHIAKNRHSGRMFGRKTARKRPKRDQIQISATRTRILLKIIYTPRLARNAPFAHLGAPRGCQSVVLSVHIAKTRQSGRMVGRKRPENGRNATELARPNFN
jgi:hypothetical protein